MKPHFKRYSPLAALILLLALFNITKFSVHANFSITEIKAVAELSFQIMMGSPQIGSKLPTLVIVRLR